MAATIFSGTAPSSANSRTRNRFSSQKAHEARSVPPPLSVLTQIRSPTVSRDLIKKVNPQQTDWPRFFLKKPR
jgi:hypothetical protein